MRLLKREQAGARAVRRRNQLAKRSSPSLTDQVLALATGKTQQEIAAACKGARPNHVGAAISRHKRAGRIEERDGKLYATYSIGRNKAPRSDKRKRARVYSERSLE
jgi:hypothetical protein